MSEVKYAVYPGTVTLYDGSERTLTGEELVELFGIADKDYIIIEDVADRPDGLEDLEYIHLTPRGDDLYPNIPAVNHDDDQEVTWDRDFDGDRQYTMETVPGSLRDHDEE